MPGRMSPRDATITRCALNRALLERQMMLRRRRVPVLDAVERLVAMQAQVPRDPYVALWSRIDRFRPDALATPIADRRAVRMTLLRGTLHLVTAPDALALRPAVQPAMERILGQTPFRRAAHGVDLDELVTFLRALLDERPRPRPELVEAIAGRWPERDASALVYAMYLVPTVQVTPRGVWGQSGRATFATVEHWLGRPLEPAGEPDDVLLRYLASFGPSTVADAQAWSGLSGLRPVFERLRPHLRTFRDESGRELFDVPGAPLPDPDIPAPVRFLPEYDNIGLAHKDRSRIIPPEVRQWTEVGWGGVLVDGFASARWRLDGEKDGAPLRIEPFRRLTRTERTEVTDEADRLLVFLTNGADTGEIRLSG